jgi:hypothetical protein
VSHCSRRRSRTSSAIDGSFVFVISNIVIDSPFLACSPLQIDVIRIPWHERGINRWSTSAGSTALTFNELGPPGPLFGCGRGARYQHSCPWSTICATAPVGKSPSFSQTLCNSRAKVAGNRSAGGAAATFVGMRSPRTQSFFVLVQKRPRASNSLRGTPP